MLQQLSSGVQMVSKHPTTGAALDSEVDVVGQWAQRLLDAMLCVTKTFAPPLPSEVVERFTATLEAAIMCAVLLPTHEQARNKVMSLLNRMVWCLRERALDRLSSVAIHLISVNSIQSLTDVFHLFDFLLSTFKVMLCCRHIAGLIRLLAGKLWPFGVPVAWGVHLWGFFRRLQGSLNFVVLSSGRQCPVPVPTAAASCEAHI